jgi:hypothetical protein
MRYWRVGLLAAALLFAQIMLAAHGIGHGFEDDASENGEVCIECLALAGTHGAPPLVVLSPVVLPATVVGNNFAVPPAPTFTRRLPFRSRAPPIIQS